MQVTKWLGLASVTLLITACFFPWVTIESKHITISGVNATGTGFGKPGFFHFFLTTFYILFLLIGKEWSSKVNLFFAALNIGWALRNYIIISTCYGGECPVKHTALYITFIASLLMLFVLLLPFKTKADEE